MACKLCGKEAGYFGSKDCGNSHRVHKACLKKSSIVFKSFEDCRYCIKEFLMGLKQSAICFKCRSNLESNKNSCKSYKNLCAKCIPMFIQRLHYDKCKTCKEICLNLVIPCTLCNELILQENLLKIPRCANQHKYCKNCIKFPALIINGCTPCSLYFNLLKKTDNENEVICNLCGRFPEGTSFFCEFNHSYCKTCLVFLKTESYVEYPRVFRCRSCLDYIKTLSIGPNGLIKPKKTEEIKYEPSYEIQENNVISEGIAYDSLERTDKNDIQIEYSDTTIKLGNNLQGDKENAWANMLVNNCCLCENKCDFYNTCGHFFCMNCLNEYTKEYIYYTISKIIDFSDMQEIKNKFILPCCYANCGKKITLPLNMILSEMTVGPKTEYSDLIYQFNPYFEGMRTRFVRCACNSVVGIIGSLRMNCQCSRQ
ncbi:hypothetical protein SteCoe_8558 [Stentor coeruleus]|uniref:RING-type domain-containing protein n=1 Tax=Stentor coeruleus TaxID=5963 RepID=A0A1R2CK28_9CILI|nr:hypothetical protein SteCoe_8558 [Stentor coeruleus]